jgi:hypothetical protein
MKKKVGITLYPLVFCVCMAILVVGIVGIAIRALASEGLSKLIGEIYD